MAVHLRDLLFKVVHEKGSDLHLKTNSPPIMRIDGKLVRMELPELNNEDMEGFLAEIFNDVQRKIFEEKKEIDVPYTMPAVSRFRVNVARERGNVRITMRVIPLKIPTIDDLQLPRCLYEVCKKHYGLVLVTGPTGSGKSTTLASMVTEINSKYPLHIITVEDPIEFVHDDLVGLVTQRQLGIDARSFLDALRTVVRQDPNVILVGEMRDADTVHTALTAAETGHLVLSTMHTGDAIETINRLMDFFPQSEQRMIRVKLASCLRAVISQRLVPRKEGVGRVAAVEVLIGTTLVKEIIREGVELGKLSRLMEEGEEVYGMQTFDRALYNLWEQDIISRATALEFATHPQDLSLRFRGLVSASTAK